MSARDDELTQRYREASEQDDARPGAHVRGAVRAHAQMLAAAAAPLPASPAPLPAAANQSRWKVSALATVAVVGLTGLLLLQFQRGTPEEQDIAYGQRRAAAPSASVQAPAAAPPAPSAPAPLERSTHEEARPPARPQAHKPAAPAEPTRPLANTAPAPALQEAEAPPVPGRVGAVSGFPASPPLPGETPAGTGTAAAPVATPAPPTAPPRTEVRERLAAQDAAAARSMAPPPPAAANEAARSSLPESAPPAAHAAAGSGLRRDDAADKRLAAAAPRADSGRSSAALPEGLREAARTGRTPQVESLIAQGVAIDARDNLGRTALMLAAANGQSATVQKLLALGANPALVDHEGLSAAQQARRLGHTRIAELIDAGS